ncbi:MarR family winged helix-turn-helix transcriptional regulator [Acidocella aquatica]|nr:MarR family transcriptional regulator [Acidocella aquatica]
MDKSKQEAPEPSRFRLGFLVHDVSRLRRTVFDAALKPLGITRSQWWVLAHLSRHETMTQRDLAKTLDLGPVALGGLIDRLEKNGFVARRDHPADRRAKQVEMTPGGKSLLNLMQARVTGINQDMLSVLTTEEIMKLDDILHRLKIRLLEMNSKE